jgi:hypothetical protein
MHLANVRAKINASEQDSEPLTIYNNTLYKLQKAYGIMYAYAGEHDSMDLFLWIRIVADDFLPLHRDLKQKAIVISLHFCRLLKQLPSQWWLDAWSFKLYHVAYELLDDDHRAWIEDDDAYQWQQ